MYGKSRGGSPPGKSSISKTMSHPSEKGARVLHIVLTTLPPRMAGSYIADALVQSFSACILLLLLLNRFNYCAAIDAP